MITDDIQMFQIKLNLTNREAAKYFGCCSERTWSNWISGTSNPPKSFLLKLDKWCDTYDEYRQTLQEQFSDSSEKKCFEVFKNFESYHAHYGKGYDDYKIYIAVVASLFNTNKIQIRYI